MIELSKAIVLIRHGESLKNIENRHGGVGEPLTDKGYKEISTDIKLFHNINFLSKPIVYYYAKCYQVIETVELITKSMEADILEDERLCPISLGVLDNFSEEEAKYKYPEVAGLLENWKKGNSEIQTVRIPNAEKLENFWKRGVSFIGDISLKTKINIIVADRSILILLINILLNRTIEIGGGYQYFKIPTGGLLR